MNRWDRLALEAMVIETKLPRSIATIVVEYAYQLMGTVVSCKRVYVSAIVKPHKSMFAMAFASGGRIHVADKCFEHPSSTSGLNLCSLLALRNGAFASGTENGNIYVWDATATRIERRWYADKSAIPALAELPDNLLATGGYPGVCVFDMVTGQRVAQLAMMRVQKVCVLRTGTILAGCAYGRIWLLRFANKNLEIVHDIKAHLSGITALVDCRNGKFVSASFDRRVCMWDYSGTMLNELDMGMMSAPLELAVLPDGRLVVGCNDERVFVWDLDTWKHSRTLVKGKASLLNHCRNLSLTVLADNKLVCASPSAVTVWE